MESAAAQAYAVVAGNLSAAITFLWGGGLAPSYTSQRIVPLQWRGPEGDAPITTDWVRDCLRGRDGPALGLARVVVSLRAAPGRPAGLALLEQDPEGKPGGTVNRTTVTYGKILATTSWRLGRFLNNLEPKEVCICRRGPCRNRAAGLHSDRTAAIGSYELADLEAEVRNSFPRRLMYLHKWLAWFVCLGFCGCCKWRCCRKRKATSAATPSPQDDPNGVEESSEEEGARCQADQVACCGEGGEVTQRLATRRCRDNSDVAEHLLYVEDRALSNPDNTDGRRWALCHHHRTAYKGRQRRGRRTQCGQHAVGRRRCARSALGRRVGERARDCPSGSVGGQRAPHVLKGLP